MEAEYARDKNRLFSRIWDMPYGRTNQFHLFDAAKNSRRFVQKLQLQIKIPVHNGCVNSICWNESGKYLLSGSDDQRLSIVHGYNYSVLAYIQTGHRANIFSAKFLPNTNDSHVVSCSGDGIIIYSDLERSETSMNNKFNCHIGTAYEIMTVPNDPNTFLSCGEDRTVRWFDLRTKSCCINDDCKEDVLINCRSPVTSLAVNPLTPYQLAVGCADASVRLFDRRMLGTHATGNNSSNGVQALMTRFTVPDFKQSRRITSLCYSADGEEMLVSYSSDYIYLFDVKDDLDKAPRVLSADSPGDSSDNETGLCFRGTSLMKRLRVRGDWSDTGPNARPEAESRGEQQETSSRATRMRWMTDVLTRMFNSSTRSRTRSTASQSSSPSSHVSSQSEASGMEASDSNDEERLARERERTETESQRTETNQPGSEPSTSKISKPDEGERSETTPDENVTSTSSAFDNEKPGTSELLLTPITVNEPSSSDTVDVNENSNVPKKITEVLSTAEGETKAGDATESLQNLEHELSSRRNDLIEKHHVEPMVNLHYSGQSVSSGLITMGVTSASAANERQWIEQSQNPAGCTDVPSSDNDITNAPSDTKEVTDTQSDTKELTDAQSDTKEVANVSSDTQEEIDVLPSSICDSDTAVPHSVSIDAKNDSDLASEGQKEDVSMNDSSTSANTGSVSSFDATDSEIDSAVQSIEPSGTRLTDEPIVSSTLNTDAPVTDPARGSSELAQGEVALMMEVDSWDIDSDEDIRPASPQPSGAAERSNSDRLQDTFYQSLDDEMKMQSEEAHMANVSQPRVKRKYMGHRNARTMIKEATFWGNNFIMSGSDCGHIFIWDRLSTELVMLMEADHHVVNCLQPHPFDPVLASSGIDYDIKLWAPLRDEPFFDMEKANEMIKRNEVMLEETKDTITVPASFMIRMLDTLNHFRFGHGSSWQRAARDARAANADPSNR